MVWTRRTWASTSSACHRPAVGPRQEAGENLPGVFRVAGLRSLEKDLLARLRRPLGERAFHLDVFVPQALHVLGIDLRVQVVHRPAEVQGEAVQVVVGFVPFLQRRGDLLGRLLGFQRPRVRFGALSAGPVELPHLGVRPDEFAAVVVEAAPGVIDVPAEAQVRIEPLAAAPQEDGLLVDLGLVQRRVDRERQASPQLPRLGTVIGLNAHGIDRELAVAAAGAGANAEAIPAVALDHLLQHLLRLAAAQTLAVGPGGDDFDAAVAPDIQVVRLRPALHVGQGAFLLRQQVGELDVAAVEDFLHRRRCFRAAAQQPAVFHGQDAKLVRLDRLGGQRLADHQLGHVQVRLQLRFIDEQGRPAAIEAVHLAVGGQFLLDLAGEVLVEVKQIANGVGILGAVQPAHRHASAGALRPFLGVAQFLIDPFDDGERFLGIGFGFLLRHLAEVDLVDRLAPAVGRLAGQEIGAQVIDAETGLGRALVVAFPAMLLEKRQDALFVGRPALGGQDRTCLRRFTGMDSAQGERQDERIPEESSCASMSCTRGDGCPVLKEAAHARRYS